MALAIGWGFELGETLECLQLNFSSWTTAIMYSYPGGGKLSIEKIKDMNGREKY